MSGRSKLALAEANPFDRKGVKAQKAVLRDLWGRWAEAKARLERSSTRSIVTYLVDHPADYRGAFARMRRELRRLYFSAFQSHLWNAILGRLIDRVARPEQRVPIELKTGTLPFHRGLESEQIETLSQTAIPLPCARTDPPAGLLGESVAQVLAPFQLTWPELKVRHLKDVFFSKGSRASVVFPQNLRHATRDDELHPGRLALELSFELAKGSYATILVKRITDVAEATSMKLDVLLEDNHCLAVNKPAGLLSQGDETGEPSLVELAKAYLKATYHKPGNVYVGLLHRLDRPTSGVVLLAKTSKCAGRLSAQFRDGAVEKLYRAIVEGRPIEREGEWIDIARQGLPDQPGGSRACGELAKQGGPSRLPCCRSLARLFGAGVESTDGPKPSAPCPARCSRVADRWRSQVWRQVAAQGGGRRLPDRAPCATIEVHAPDSPGSDFGRCAGAGRLARAFARAVGIRLLVQYARGRLRPVTMTAANGRQA